MIKQIPNMISLLRILITALLIPMMGNRTVFFGLYVLIGLSDVLDGFIARKLKCESELGARLDSFADLAFFSVYTYIFLAQYGGILEIGHLVGLGSIILIRLSNMVLTKRKYDRVVFIHTIANKASGLILFLLPILLLINQRGVIWFTLVVVSAAALEELMITIRYDEVELDRRSIFIR